MTLDGEIKAVAAVARQLRTATRPPEPRRLQSWARSLDSAVRGLERGVAFLRAQEPPSAAVPPEEGGAGTDTPVPAPEAVQRRRRVQARAVVNLPRAGTAGRQVLDAVAAVARDPRTAGLTDWEIAEVTGLSANTVRPRRGELLRGGWLLDSGATRQHHGKAHRVWVLSDKAAGSLAG